MIASSTTPATRLDGRSERSPPAAAAWSSTSQNIVTSGTKAARRLLRMLGQQLLGELRHDRR